MGSTCWAWAAAAAWTTTTMTTATCGVRPLVSLKSDTKLEKLGNNQYELTDSDTIDGNSTWQYEHDGKITIIDKESGVSSAVSSNNILIAWSESNTVEPTNWNYISNKEFV